MSHEPKNDATNSDENPLIDFSNCHIGIVKNFERLLLLSKANIQSPVQKEIQLSAKSLLDFFNDVVIEHHAEEENELFREVTDSAKDKSENSAAALQMIKQLTDEHRSLEAQWSVIADDIKRLSKGKKATLNQEASAKLAKEYLAHAGFEEEYFLPLSAKILGERGLSSLGLSLHMRHTNVDIPFYI